MSFSHEEIEKIEAKMFPVEKLVKEVLRDLSMEIEKFEYKYIFDYERGIIKIRFYKKK
jgi:hypothetical protein